MCSSAVRRAWARRIWCQGHCEICRIGKVIFSISPLFLSLIAKRKDAAGDPLFPAPCADECSGSGSVTSHLHVLPAVRKVVHSVEPRQRLPIRHAGSGLTPPDSPHEPAVGAGDARGKRPGVAHCSGTLLNAAFWFLSNRNVSICYELFLSSFCVRFVTCLAVTISWEPPGWRRGTTATPLSCAL